MNNFMKKVEDLNVALSDKDTTISALNSELEDVKEQHELLQKHYDEKVSSISLIKTLNQFSRSLTIFSDFTLVKKERNICSKYVRISFERISQLIQASFLKCCLSISLVD